MHELSIKSYFLGKTKESYSRLMFSDFVLRILSIKKFLLFLCFL